MYALDKLAFEKSLKGAGVFSAPDRFDQGKKAIINYYQMWMKSVEPKGN